MLEVKIGIDYIEQATDHESRTSSVNSRDASFGRDDYVIWLEVVI